MPHPVCVFNSTVDRRYSMHYLLCVAVIEYYGHENTEGRFILAYGSREGIHNCEECMADDVQNRRHTKPREKTGMG